MQPGREAPLEDTGTQNAETVPDKVDDPEGEQPLDLADTSNERAQLRQLWHQQLGHVNFQLLGEMHKYVKGVPKLGKAHPLDKCATCMREKLRRANSSSQLS